MTEIGRIELRDVGIAPIDVSQRGPDWHAARAKHVGGSECSALFDCQPEYALSRFALWMTKAGRVPPPEVDNARARWGLRLEPFIAEVAAEENGWTVSKGGYISDPTTSGLGCTLDYIVNEPGQTETELGFAGPGALELKASDWLAHRRTWTDEEPPPHVLLQLQHQLAATGYSWGVVACFVGGNDLRIYRYRVREKLIAEIRKRVAEFWQSIREGKEPPIDGSDGAKYALRTLFPEVEDDVIDLTGDNEWPTLCAELLDLSERRKTLEKDEAARKNAIELKLAGHRRGFGGGYAASFSITPEKPKRPATPGEIIHGRSEVRRLLVKESS